ncbi:MAG TPA: hypothetical protein VFM14_17750 [Gemmatimonadales bacterium]|nr:hypothetical protein [Gemmatimonadales bacterium]
MSVLQPDDAVAHPDPAAEIRTLTDVIVARSGAVVAIGKRTFYGQVEADTRAAYETAGEAMTCNMAYEDAAERIETFLGKRSAVWRGH